MDMDISCHHWDDEFSSSIAIILCENGIPEEDYKNSFVPFLYPK